MARQSDRSPRGQLHARPAGQSLSARQRTTHAIATPDPFRNGRHWPVGQARRHSGGVANWRLVSGAMRATRSGDSGSSVGFASAAAIAPGGGGGGGGASGRSSTGSAARLGNVRFISVVVDSKLPSTGDMSQLQLYFE